MTTNQRRDGNEPKIIEFTSVEEQAKAGALARYWDATVKGQPADSHDIDPELTVVVHLLRHYHDVTRLQRDASAIVPTAFDGLPVVQPRATAPPGSGGWRDPARPMTLVAAAMLGLFVAVFALNTLISPRSWLWTTGDPDWIPWVSDDWLGAGRVGL